MTSLPFSKRPAPSSPAANKAGRRPAISRRSKMRVCESSCRQYTRRAAQGGSEGSQVPIESPYKDGAKARFDANSFLFYQKIRLSIIRKGKREAGKPVYGCPSFSVA